jgi:hypothetical protein
VSDVHPSCVFIGAQAMYRAGEGRAFVRNHIHWHGAYLRAFRAAGLEVDACRDLLLRRSETDMIATGLRVSADLVAEALVGFPAVVVWELSV